MKYVLYIIYHLRYLLGIWYPIQTAKQPHAILLWLLALLPLSNHYNPVRSAQRQQLIPRLLDAPYKCQKTGEQVCCTARLPVLPVV